ncbi:glycosyltransferase [Variovorax sp. dw_954]|uniref:glycosyltransferase n=1 Tax=Variovorax sp. dw_954 TaxID=2720078 RepID=UPI001BD4BCD1|nr:glycosyltransferase [Variovorax sp. dw_954]
MKKWKKDIFIRICRRCGVYRNIVWHASTELEALDIRRTLGPLASDIRVALDVSLPPQRTEGGISFLNVDRLPLKICFISRISRKKNLHYALQVLNRVTANVVFNVYGPCEDEVYMAECASMSVGMPPNVRVNYCGPLEYSLVSEMLASHHLFFFPTLGENFGHVIAESLAAGTPVLVSDQTPWRNLNQYGAGWDFSLADPSVFSDAIERVSGMRAADYLAMRRCAETYTLGLGVDRARDDMLICLFETMAA